MRDLLLVELMNGKGYRPLNGYIDVVILRLFERADLMMLALAQYPTPFKRDITFVLGSDATQGDDVAMSPTSPIESMAGEVDPTWSMLLISQSITEYINNLNGQHTSVNKVREAVDQSLGVGASDSVSKRWFREQVTNRTVRDETVEQLNEPKKPST